jgi:hypothetical protein
MQRILTAASLTGATASGDAPMNAHTHARTLPLAVALAFGAACGSSKPPASLSLSANASAQVAAVTTPSVSTPAGTISLDLGNGIALTEVRMVVRKLKVTGGKAAPSASRIAPGSDGLTELEKEADSGDPELGPVLVDLEGATLAGGIRVVFDGKVEQGDYSALKLAIGPVTAAQAGSDQTLAAAARGGAAVDGTQGLAAMAARNASLIVDGVVAQPNGTTSFEFVSSITAELERVCELTVNDVKPNNLTLALDPTRWFGGTGLARLDPSDPGSKAGIEANILASISAFEDDNKSGQRHVGP